MKKRLYLCTDGRDTIDERLMTKEEADEANRAATIATDGTFGWCLANKPRGRAGGRHPKDPTHLWLRYIIRLPPEWKDDLKAEYGTLQKAIETLVIEHRQAPK